MKINCLGDSITEGWGLPDPETQSFPYLLEKEYPAHHFRNFGSPGAIVQPFGYEYEKTLPYKIAMQTPADLSLLLLGSNDALAYGPGFKTAYENLLDTIGVPVVLITPPKMGLKNNALPAIREDILHIAKERNLPVIDLYSASDPGWLSEDMVHPTEYGQRQIAKVVSKGLEPLLSGC